MCFVFQSKEIGIQMHEELVKVTNELYTVSGPDQSLTPPLMPGFADFAWAVKAILVFIVMRNNREVFIYCII